MASRNFNRYQALEKEAKALHLDVSIGAAGAPTKNSGLGVASISRTTNGEYLITLDDKYTRLLDVSMSHENSTAEDLKMQIKEEDVNGAKTISVYTNTGATPTDPANGTKLRFRIELKNSSVGE